MPMLYGEGKNAFLRLQLEVIRMTDDQSILAWGWRSNTESANGFLANDPSSFRDCSHVVRVTTRDILDTLEQYFSKDQLRRLISAEEHSRTFAVTNRGIQIWLPLKFEGRDGHSEYFSALLACREVRGDRATPITIPIMQFGRSLSRHFGRPPAVGNQRASIECKSILLPFRDNVTPNIRGLSRKLRRSHISLEDILSSDSVILVLGTSRSGKSNFINKLTTTPPKAFPDRLPVRTKIASAYVTVCQGKRFAFVDTPPLDRDGFETISRQLGFLYRRPVKFAGVIYTFNLNSRWVGEEVRNLQTVLNMCGEEAIDRLRVVLTIWDGVDSEYCTKVQAELDNLLAKIPKAGACCQKFDNTAASAWAIVEGLGDEKKVLSLQRAMVDDRIDLPQTSAREWISELLCM
ncbi:hypothetical protein EDD15DRAFT_2302285 [Pisolithus albus]|nr:hypothetical protein EDD15DRAFT_2302285 [Pisolithus albus]